MKRLLGVAVLIAMIAVTALAGRSYRWCIPAARVAPASCCSHDAASEREAPATDAIRAACCEDRAFGSLPATDPRLPVPVVPPARLSSADVAPIFGSEARPSAPDLGRRVQAEPATARAGPPAAGRWKVLQVIRC